MREYEVSINGNSIDTERQTRRRASHQGTITGYLPGADRLTL